MNSKGLFITFEGIEGCGKTTQIQLLENFLKSRGHETVITREPGGTPTGEKIREILLDEKTELSENAEFLLFSVSRNQLVREIIQPALKAGKIVISDRFYDSSFAYQGYGRGINLEIIDYVTKLSVMQLKPDLTFYLEIDVETSLNRVIERGSKDRFEKLDFNFYKRVLDGYKRICTGDPWRIKCIDSRQSPDETHKQIVKTVLGQLQ